MSFKFSRRSTRVQRKPHVCVSEPQPWPSPAPPPTPIGPSPDFIVVYLYFNDGTNYGEFNPNGVSKNSGTQDYEANGSTIPDGNSFLWLLTLPTTLSPAQVSVVPTTPNPISYTLTGELPATDWSTPTGTATCQLFGPVDPDAFCRIEW